LGNKKSVGLSSIRLFLLCSKVQFPSFEAPNILWSLEVASVREYWFSAGSGDYFLDPHVWRADTIELTLRDPAVNVTVSMMGWPATKRDTTKYILFDAVSLEAE
jgi:hypothetical protein